MPFCACLASKQCFGSVFIFSGSGSRVWGWRPIRIRIRIQGFNDQKLKKNYSWKIFLIFFSFKNCNLPIHVQVTEEAFSSQKRPPNTSKHELLQFFSYFCGSFLPSWIQIRIRIPNPDPDPLARLNTDPIRIRIRNPASKFSKSANMTPKFTPSENLRGRISRKWRKMFNLKCCGQKFIDQYFYSCELFCNFSALGKSAQNSSLFEIHSLGASSSWSGYTVFS